MSNLFSKYMFVLLKSFLISEVRCCRRQRFKNSRVLFQVSFYSHQIFTQTGLSASAASVAVIITNAVVIPESVLMVMYLHITICVLVTCRTLSNTKIQISYHQQLNIR